MLKPALYAQAGIPYYWRIETGRWTKFVDTGEPFPVNLSVAHLTPWYL
ncbi:hypothetical protein [Micromonospora sp. NPDC047134]